MPCCILPWVRSAISLLFYNCVGVYLEIDDETIEASILQTATLFAKLDALKVFADHLISTKASPDENSLTPIISIIFVYISSLSFLHMIPSNQGERWVSCSIY